MWRGSEPPHRSCIEQRFWPPDSEDTNEENGGDNVSPKNNLDKRRPAGDSPAPDMSMISKGETEESGKTVEKLQDLLRLAERGEEDAVPEIHQILDERPDLAWRFVDVAHIAEDSLIEVMTKEQDLATKELIRCQLEALREQIAGKNSSALERLLPERVVVTGLEVQFFEALYAKNVRKLTIPQAEHYQKRLDRAHRRHLSAIRALAQIRKLLKGTAMTQINIAEKQINTTG
jgi:hypothetical protein